MIFGAKQYLEYQDAGGRTRKVPVRGTPFIIGSDASANLSVSHPDISPRHAALRRTGADWEIEVVGHTPLVVEGVKVERGSTLKSGETVEIAGVFSFVFRDLDAEEEARRKARQAGLPVAEKKAVDPSTRIRILALLIFSIVLSLLLGLVAMVRSPRGGVDMTSISLSSIEVAVGSIGDCIEDAAKAGRSSEAWAEASYGPYWRLVVEAAGGPKGAAADGSSSALDGLKADVDAWLRDGMLFESRGQTGGAIDAYDKVVRAVPDVACPAHKLASARLGVLR